MYSSTLHILLVYVILFIRLRHVIHSSTHYNRDPDASDTESTDPGSGWGGLGMYEYSLKGLPHGLVHARELVETYGHHGACCTCVGEAGHKCNIKNAAKFARIYADRNDTQGGMLGYVQRQQLWTAVFELNEREAAQQSSISAGADDSNEPERCPPTQASATRTSFQHKLREPLPDLTQGWSFMSPVRGRPPSLWGATFLSNRVLITRNELITLLRTKLEMEDTWANVVLLAKRVQWACYGCVLIGASGDKHRQIVGTSTVAPERRDCVRIRGNEDNTALSVQVRT